MHIIIAVEWENLLFPKKSKKNPKKKFLQSKLCLFTAYIVLLCIGITGGIYTYITIDEDSAANVTDSIVRPILGDQRTISLEAIFFNVEDRIHLLTYHLTQSRSDDTAFAQSTAPKTATPSATPAVEFSLETIPPIDNQPELPEEGEWNPLVSTDEAVLLAKTFVQPDKERPYARVELVKMNMKKLQIGIVAGLKQPGGPQEPGPGIVPIEIQTSNNLLAAFSGGFQQKDGYYGMIVENTVYLPLKQTLATLVMYKNDQPELIKYTGQKLDGDITGIRQNCPMLIENSQIVTSSTAWDMQTWGLTTTNTMYTWRSGLGITKEGDLIYASGPSLVPETLAKALQAAGAVNAMQLDINPFWVRFALFNALGKGRYQYTPLEISMINGGYEYLHGYQKDFFYVYKK